MIAWPAIWAWMRGVPARVWAYAAIGLAVLFEMHQVADRAREKQKAKDKAAAEKAETKARVELDQTAKQITQEAHDAQTRAQQAGDSLPEYRSVGELRDAHPDIANGIVRGP